MFTILQLFLSASVNSVKKVSDILIF